MDYLAGLVGNICIFIILSQSLHLVNGVSGQFSLGHAAFWGIGAYVGSLVSIYYPLSDILAVNALASCGVAFLASSLVACFIGYPCSKLKGDYLAITTLGFGEIIKATIENLELTGGPRGLTAIPRNVELSFIVLSTGVVVIVLNNFLRSKYGRLLFAICEDSVAAEFLGVPAAKFRLLAFSVGCGIAGIAGSLFAHHQEFIHPSNFSFNWSVIILLMTIVGGIGNSFGSILGAVGVAIVPEVLRFIPNMSEFRLIIFSGLLIVIMLFKPTGFTKGVKISAFGTKVIS